MTKECLACVVNPYSYCANCKRKFCKECIDKRGIDPVDRCPDRPLYGPRDDGHFRVDISPKRLPLVMGSPIIGKIPKPKHNGYDCELC